MFAFLDKKLLSRHGTWNHKSQTLIPKHITQPHPVILVHGFIGSPYDFRPLAESLVNKGYQVVIPATPGQNWTLPPRDRGRFSRKFYVNWLTDIVREQTVMTGKKPYLAGLSMGGAVSTIVASKGLVEKLVLLAPFYKLPKVGDRIWETSKRLAPILPVIPKLRRGKINSKAGYCKYIPGSFLISLRAFNVLGDIAKQARLCATSIHVPTKIALSMNDQVADPEMTLSLFQNRSNVDFYFENRANHILLYDFGAQRIVQEILAFFDS